MKSTIQLVDSANHALHAALDHLCHQIDVNGHHPDSLQIACFDIANVAAQLQAAEFCTDFIEELADGGDTLERGAGLVFVAEALQAASFLLSQRRLDFGLNKQTLDTTIRQARIVEFCEHHLCAENLERVGDLAFRAGGSTGDYRLGEAHAMIYETFRRFADDVVAPLAGDIHRQDLGIPDEILAPLKEMGCFGLSVPGRYGGIKDDETEDTMGMIVVTEALSTGSLGAAGSLITRPEIIARALLNAGSESQKQKWLPALAAGEPLCAVAVTEPNYGSNVAEIQLKATRVDGGWRLNGAKTWCTFAAKAGVLMVLARTDTDPTAGHRGLSAFLVEKEPNDEHAFEYAQDDGAKLTGRAIATLGYRGMHSYDLFFDNFFVADENLIGESNGVGRGFYAVMAGFAGGRIQTAARAVGVMQSAYEMAIQYAGERKVFGQPIGSYALSKARFATMAARIIACRQFTYAVARQMDRGPRDMEASLVKLFACRSAEWLTRDAQQLHGGMGYAEEMPISRLFVDARVLSIFEGAEETLALKVISRGLIERARARRQAEAVV